jgi:hypothetical protein
MKTTDTEIMAEKLDRLSEDVRVLKLYSRHRLDQTEKLNGPNELSNLWLTAGAFLFAVATAFGAIALLPPS